MKKAEMNAGVAMLWGGGDLIFFLSQSADNVEKN